MGSSLHALVQPGAVPFETKDNDRHAANMLPLAAATRLPAMQ
jgi:hypothetical protein